MKSFEVTCQIHAPVARVWALLTDVAAWPAWNTTVPKVQGTVALGQQVTVYTTASPGRAFPVKVSELEPPRRMVWTGGMPLGLFTGRRTYTLREDSPGSTTFTMSEAFTGPMAPLITRSIPDLQPLFDEFAVCLKRAAEAGSAAPAQPLAA
ncbi:MAG: SRPBCC domain-containing protein [Rubrivivax sp.]|nr:SRPBCC domain-containing protein [Rubrivivax sp.]